MTGVWTVRSLFGKFPWLETASTVATYCPSRPLQLTHTKNITKNMANVWMNNGVCTPKYPRNLITTHCDASERLAHVRKKKCNPPHGVF